jgi:hypothetical protein
MKYIATGHQQESEPFLITTTYHTLTTKQQSFTEHIPRQSIRDEDTLQDRVITRLPLPQHG